MTKPIELDFPIAEVNEIANEEGKGGTSRPSFEPLLYIHKWWAKRLGSVFRTIVIYTLLDENATVIEDDGTRRKVTKEELENPWSLYLKDVDFGGKIVLDPMMGAGTTIIEALRTNCKAIGQDLNPVAWFTVKKAVEPVDVDELERAYKKLEEEVAEDIKKYYRTICPHCLAKYAKLHDKKPDEVVREVIEKLNNSSSHGFFYPFQVAIASDSGIALIRSVFILLELSQPLSSKIRSMAFSSEATHSGGRSRNK